MKRLLEPTTGIVLSFLSWAAWTDLLVSLLVAFLGGAFAYLGKWVAAWITRQIYTKKNVFKSKALEAENSIKSPEEPML